MASALRDLLLCLHPDARLGLLGSAALVAGTAGLLLLRHRRCARLFVAASIALLALIIWLGSLRLSPLGLGFSRLPLLSGLEIRRAGRVPATIKSGDLVVIASGSAMAIHPLLLPGPVDCSWSASGGGALDDPRSCDTVYAAPSQPGLEVLRLRLRSSCGLLPVVERIRISILP